MSNDQLGESGRSSSDGGIQVIGRAIAILRTLRNHPDGLSLSQIAREVDLARSTVHRIVSTLEGEQFVVQAAADGGGYRLGPALAILGAAVSLNLRDQLRPHLESLFAEINETIDLAILDHDQLVFIDQIAAPHRLQAVSAIKGRFPLHCTANGKAVLAQMTREQRDHILPDPLPAFTENTITNRDHLEQELERVRVEGVAYDREEHTLGICAVGTAFYDPLGSLAAVSVPVPSIRYYGNEERLAAALLKAGEEIQGALAKM